MKKSLRGIPNHWHSRRKSSKPTVFWEYKHRFQLANLVLDSSVNSNMVMPLAMLSQMSATSGRTLDVDDSEPNTFCKRCRLIHITINFPSAQINMYGLKVNATSERNLQTTKLVELGTGGDCWYYMSLHQTRQKAKWTKLCKYLKDWRYQSCKEPADQSCLLIHIMTTLTARMLAFDCLMVDVQDESQQQWRKR